MAASISYRTIKCYMVAVRSLQIDLGLGYPITAMALLICILQGVKSALSVRGPSRAPRLPVTRDPMLLIRSALVLIVVNSRFGQPPVQPG